MTYHFFPDVAECRRATPQRLVTLGFVGVPGQWPCGCGAPLRTLAIRPDTPTVVDDGRNRFAVHRLYDVACGSDGGDTRQWTKTFLA